MNWFDHQILSPRASFARHWSLALALTTGSLTGCNDASFNGNESDKARSSEANPGDPSTDPRALGDGEKFKTNWDAEIHPVPDPGSVVEAGWVAPIGVIADGGSTTPDGNPTGDPPPGKTNDGKLDELIDETGEPNIVDGAEGVLWLPCDRKTGTTNVDSTFRGEAGTKVRVMGEFCPLPDKEAKLTVLFVVDFSGSMIGGGGGFEGPNDPSSGNNCGRLRAAEAVVDQLKDEQDDSDASIKVGMIGFSDDASTRIGLRTIKRFEDEIDHGNFCGADGETASTNYQAAFNRAKAELEDVEGNKVVYFISDGSPRTGGIDPASAGLRAAEDLRDDIDDLQLNIVFLGYSNGDANDPRGYLEDLAGDKDRVTLARDADDLVEKIKEIELPASPLDTDSFVATLELGSDSRSVDLVSLTEHPTRKGTWLYRSDLFALTELGGVHVLTIAGETEAGSRLRSRAKIRLQP